MSCDKRKAPTEATEVMVDSSSSLNIGAVQPELRQPDLSPISAAEHATHLIRQAVAQHDGVIDLFVLPELSPIGYSEDTFEKYLPSRDPEPKDSKKTAREADNTRGAIDLLFASLAKELRCYICYGAVGVLKEDGSPERYTIRQNVINDEGEPLCFYDKIHLCDYGDCAETRFFRPGKKVCSFECRGFKIGIIICADMRNPSLSRQLASKAHNCDVILQPAAFSRDISFRTWKSFRETRAVENSVYFVGVNYAGDNFGNTAFVEPWVDENNEPEVLGTEEDVLIKQVRRDVLRRIRREFPYYGQVMRESWHLDSRKSVN